MPDLQTHSDLVPKAREEADAVIASIKGDIDLHKSPEMRTALLSLVTNRTVKKLILNLGAVNYMDSSAIAVLVETLQRLRKTGGKIYLTNLQPRVKGLLEIARLDSIFVVAKDEADALAK
jgi:anti-sigma B factor antagonist